MKKSWECRLFKNSLPVDIWFTGAGSIWSALNDLLESDGLHMNVAMLLEA